MVHTSSMNRWLLRALNALLLLVVLAAIPFGIRAYEPIEQNNKAIQALENKEYDKAIALLSDAVERNPNNSTFRKNLLAAYNSKAIDIEHSEKESTGALQWYEKALKIEPGNQTILRNYISSLNNLAVDSSGRRDFTTSQGFFELARGRLTTLSDQNVRGEIMRNYSALLTLWGAELMKRNQIPEATLSFEQALKLDGKNSVASIYLGDLFYESNEYPKSQAFYESALKTDKDNTDYLNNRLQMIEDESKVEGLLKTSRDPQGHFFVQAIEYSNGVSVPEIYEILTSAYNEIGKDLGIYPARAVNVKIYNGVDFYKISKLPEWAIGIFDGKMRLKLEDVQSAPSQVKDLLFHEYTHAVLAMNIKQRVPAWFHEGLAQLMEPQFKENPREQAQMRDALARNKMNFESLKDSFKDITSKDDAETAYLLSKYFLNSLNRKYGRDKMVEWIKQMAAEVKFDEAFEKVYGVTLASAQEAWMRQVKN